MVDALAPLLEEARDRGIGARRLEQFDRQIPRAEEGELQAHRFDRLLAHPREAEPAPALDRGTEGADRDPHVGEAGDDGGAHGIPPGWLQRRAITAIPSAIRYQPKGASPRLVT